MPLWGSLVLVATSIKYYSLFTINYSLTSVTCIFHFSLFHFIIYFMNLVSIILLSVVLLAFVMVAISYFKGNHGKKSCCDTGDGNGKKCDCGNCNGCGFH